MTRPTQPIDAFAKPGTDLNKGLRAIKDADPTFEPKTFVDGAKMAYEMIVMAYADGDRKTLKNLLSREVYDGFVAAIADREARSEKIQSSFVGIDKADIVSAEMKGGEAHVTLRIVSELISATRDKRRRGHRRRSGDRGRGQGRLDLRPRHPLARSELEAGRHRSRRLIAPAGRGSTRGALPALSAGHLSTSFPAGATTITSAAFEAFRRSAFHVLAKPYRTGALGVDFAAFAEAYRGARDMRRRPIRPKRARSSNSISCRCASSPRTADKALSPASTSRRPRRRRSARTRFTVPLLSRPADLVDIDDQQPAGRAWTRISPSAAARDAGIVEYFDRPAIEQGALAGRGLEIAWLADKVDAFFIHVQGAARLNMTDGTTAPRHLCGQIGQRFTGPGKILAELGEIPLDEVTMQSIRAWFRDTSRSHRRDPLAEPLLHLLSRSAGRRSGARADCRGESSADAGPFDGRRPAAAHIRHAVLHRRAVADGVRRQAVSAADDRPGHRLGDHRAGARRSLCRIGRCGRRDRRRRAQRGRFLRAGAARRWSERSLA